MLFCSVVITCYNQMYEFYLRKISYSYFDSQMIYQNRLSSCFEDGEKLDKSQMISNLLIIYFFEGYERKCRFLVKNFPTNKNFVPFMKNFWQKNLMHFQFLKKPASLVNKYYNIDRLPAFFLKENFWLYKNSCLC